jgi:hypothetical protein
MLIANYQLVIIFKLNTYCSLYFFAVRCKISLPKDFLLPKTLLAKFTGGRLGRIIADRRCGKKSVFLFGTDLSAFFQRAGNPQKEESTPSAACQGTQSM